ncbi:glycosyl transferase [Pseudomonas alkylphenolica]|uniref:Glycosyl transferase n=1 Tax=Pseudomonas alkylphenolica TaxID=237609 RepID=A0A443ZNR1_9PSED|nr:glycosyltransferase [Pseudomonas alkylphenolica]RWU20718.1 glycosyl transferase [Pseudomonas alkylphenolica]
MIEIATGKRSDVTVVLLGHDQADHRARALHYYREAGVPCLALQPLSANASGAQFCERLSQALAQVTTPFVTLAQDADFVLATALDNAAAHLHEQPQLAAVQGYALAYAAGNAEVAYHKSGVSFAPAAGEGAIARLKQYAQAGQQAWRAVSRVAVLQAALAEVPQALDVAGVRTALSCVLLADGAIAQLEQTDVICEYAPCALTPVVREERVNQTVRTLRQWDADRQRLYADDAGFAVLNGFVRSSHEQGEEPLLFTSGWKSVIDDPERVFEPRQYVELPYYNRALFEQLTALEFLCHAWPTGQRQQQALEGIWVRQRDLMQVHPNDTPESLQARYWQAMALGLFNLSLCQQLMPMLSDGEEGERVRELNNWLQRLQQVPGIEMHERLRATPSGKVLEAIAAATPDEQGRQRVLAHLASHPAGQIAFVVLDLNDDDLALQATFDSLLASGVRNFKLVVLKAGNLPTITTPRDTLHFIQVTESNWATHLNHVVKQLPSEWLLLLQAGDVLLAGGLLRLMVELGEAPACQAIAANEVQRDQQGRLLSVVRPGANLDLLRSQPGLMSRHWLVRRQAVLDLGGFSETSRQALELDLLLRLVETQGLGSLAHMDEYLVIGQQASPALVTEAQAILNRHLTQLGYRSQVSDQGAAGLLIDFRHSATPLVSILLAHEGDNAQLQACLTSVLQRTRYPRYEVLVACVGDHVEIDAAAFQAFAGRVRLLAGEPGASQGELLNLAASEARGDYLVLLSEHAQVVTPAWIEGLLNEAQRPEVGVVGARLQTADGTLAHAGYELLAGPSVHAPWAGAAFEQDAVNFWPLSVRSCTAVSEGCLMVRKQVFEHVGGLVSAPGADVELCLAAAQAGLAVVWTPRAQLFVSELSAVDESVSRALAERWPTAFTGRAPFSVSLEWLAQLA